MAIFNELTALALEAAADLSGKQYHIVRASAAGKTNQASEAVHSSMFGVLQNKPQSGETATVAYAGPSKVVAGGAVTANAFVTCNGSGRAADVASGQMTIGRALEAATTDGEVISVLLQSPTRWSGAV